MIVVVVVVVVAVYNLRSRPLDLRKYDGVDVVPVAAVVYRPDTTTFCWPTAHLIVYSGEKKPAKRDDVHCHDCTFRNRPWIYEALRSRKAVSYQQCRTQSILCTTYSSANTFAVDNHQPCRRFARSFSAFARICLWL
jgi:hypothetical protein